MATFALVSKVTSEIVIECNKLNFAYGKQLVLEDVDFAVNKGESLCVIGPNGGGKSTLLKLILGLLEPSTGSLNILGQLPNQGRSQIGYVPQAMRYDALFPVKAIDIALMGRLDRLGLGSFSKHCREVAMNALDEVDMADLAKRPFADLSGGQRQRVMIARALACEPQILLLDEPTANIDLSVEAAFIETLHKLRRTNMTILLVTHDLGVVAQIGDSALCVNHHVHRHRLPLDGETIREIYSSVQRIKHDRKTRHKQGDHSRCDHD